MVKNIQKQMSAIDGCVNRLTRGTIISTFATAKKTAVQVDKLGYVADTIKTDTGVITAATRDIKTDTSVIRTSVNELQRSNEKGFSHMMNVLDETKRNAECKLEHSRRNLLVRCSKMFHC